MTTDAREQNNTAPSTLCAGGPVTNICPIGNCFHACALVGEVKLNVLSGKDMH